MGRILLVVLLPILGLVATSPGFVVWRHPWMQGCLVRMQGRWTIADRLAAFGSVADARWSSAFAAAGVAYPPGEVALLAFKDVKRLEVHARTGGGGPWHWVRTCPILAASGGPGPKLREGDRQVPEGFYGIELLNPNSQFHVSLRLDYPNAADRQRAMADGRDRLGGDIMIHGSSVSVGCLAMGDEAAEDLFTLAARCGIGQVRVIIAPSDPRRRPLVARSSDPVWVAALYRELATTIRDSPAEHQPASPSLAAPP